MWNCCPSCSHHPGCSKVTCIQAALNGAADPFLNRDLSSPPSSADDFAHHRLASNAKGQCLRGTPSNHRLGSRGPVSASSENYFTPREACGLLPQETQGRKHQPSPHPAFTALGSQPSPRPLVYPQFQVFLQALFCVFFKRPQFYCVLL